MKKFLHKIKFDKWKAWLYLLPAIILLVIFTVWPIINTVKMAFTVYWDATEYVDTDGDGINDKMGAFKPYSLTMDMSGDVDFEFGLSNFTDVVKDAGFKTIMKNTVLLCVLTVPLSTLLALFIAVCLNAIKPLQRFLQTIFFLPYVTNSIAIGMVFAAMFNIVGVNVQDVGASTSLGIINSILGVFGIDPINWINVGYMNDDFFSSLKNEYLRQSYRTQAIVGLSGSYTYNNQNKNNQNSQNRK